VYNELTYQDYILDALEMISAWEIPEHQLAEAVNAQARLMAGLHYEDVAQRDSFSYYS
jgi:hypothetical protein